TELRSLVGAEGGKQITLRFALNADALFVRAPAGVGDARKARAAIARIGRAQHEAVRFEAFDELRDVGFDAGEPLGQLPQRERLVGRDQGTQRRELRQGQADGGEPRVDAALESAGGVENVEKNCQSCFLRLFAYSTTAHTSSLLRSLLNAGISGCLRPFHTL